MDIGVEETHVCRAGVRMLESGEADTRGREVTDVGV